MVGAVRGVEEVEEDEVVGTDISTNTLATSQWHDNGSQLASRPGSVSSRPGSGHLAPPNIRRRITSWDSD